MTPERRKEIEKWSRQIFAWDEGERGAAYVRELLAEIDRKNAALDVAERRIETYEDRMQEGTERE